ncbi:MAG: hypothetical protein ACKVRN_02070 [Pyrinomonadaceae bacterium]
MWKARTKNDLIIEVWEKLDCENVGAAELEAIETVVTDQYSESAVESPMVIARLLADEGAQLRHPEIMKLYVKRTSKRPHDGALRNIVKIDDLKEALASIRNLENLRRKYAASNDRQGLRLVRETALISGKQSAIEKAGKKDLDTKKKQVNAEIAEWFTIWLQTPEVFESWVTIRQKSSDFIEKFGSDK